VQKPIVEQEGDHHDQAVDMVMVARIGGRRKPDRQAVLCPLAKRRGAGSMPPLLDMVF